MPLKDHLDCPGGARRPKRPDDSSNLPRQGWSLFTREAARSRGKAMRKAREAQKSHMECLGGSREPFGRHQGGTRDAGKDTREAPGRQERTNWTAWEAPGRHQGGRKGLIGQPGWHQKGAREAGKD